ncbi:MAG: UDP-N-acetylmuramoyl-L-alanyl-D-glutamate--2,6-diaminopimelate ligase [Nitrospinota bacterium]
MVKLRQLLKGLGEMSASGPLDADITGIAYDSRRVEPGHLFAALPGTRTDGETFLEEAVRRGAAGLLVRDLADARARGLNASVAVVEAADIRRALARVADAFYGHPSQRVRVVGITGTNGKTTWTYLAESILRAAGRSAGVIGTISYRWGGSERPAGQTTPEAPDLQAILREMADAGVDHCLMEVSSHGLSLKRVEGIRFEAAVFSNLTQDHLDFHETIDAYFEAKRSLFTRHPVGRAIVNVDDPYGARIWDDVQDTPAGRAGLTYGLSPGAAVRAREIENNGSGLRFRLAGPGGEIPVRLRLLGAHNVYNALAAAAAGLALGIGLEGVAEGLARLENAPGRFERIDLGQPFAVVVDYAHTEDALRRVLKTARELVGGRLIAVMGCGGDRDRSKRPRMGAAAAEVADHVVVTSDNPRTEDPAAILREIEPGILALGEGRASHEMCVDRREAIRRALAAAGPGDGVVIAGKGHETYQVVGRETLPFDDREEARRALRALGYGGEAPARP